VCSSDLLSGQLTQLQVRAAAAAVQPHICTAIWVDGPVNCGALPALEIGSDLRQPAASSLLQEELAQLRADKEADAAEYERRLQVRRCNRVLRV